MFLIALQILFIINLFLLAIEDVKNFSISLYKALISLILSIALLFFNSKVFFPESIYNIDSALFRLFLSVILLLIINYLIEKYNINFGIGDIIIFNSIFLAFGLKSTYLIFLITVNSAALIGFLMYSFYKKNILSLNDKYFVKKEKNFRTFRIPLIPFILFATLLVFVLGNYMHSPIINYIFSFFYEK